MTEWRGIPREKIPWFPKIDKEKCTGCGTCIEFCKNGVLDFDPETQQARVRSPYDCVIECITCARLCPAGAISFPDEKEFGELIEKLLREQRQKGGSS
jgi:NAD-dependent dihydropyrimidine dehydrogenase PreA subunit